MVAENTVDDDACMRRVRAGDIHALAVLFERHSELVRAYCRKMTRSGEMADDLVQDVFLRILKYRDSYRGESSFATWMFKIAYRACLDQLGKPRVDSLDSDVEDPGASSSAHGLLESRREVDRLFAAMAQLPRDAYSVLQLRWLRGLPYAAIAQELGCTESAARVRSHRAMERLRAVYGSVPEA